jgi:hypothetical protein
LTCLAEASTSACASTAGTGEEPVRKIRTPGSVRRLLGNWQSDRNGGSMNGLFGVQPAAQANQAHTPEVFKTSDVSRLRAGDRGIFYQKINIQFIENSSCEFRMGAGKQNFLTSIGSGGTYDKK